MLLPTPVVAQPEDRSVELVRFAGATRVETATLIAGADPAATGAGFGNDNVLVARADGFADGLAGAYLAGILNAPVLLTHQASVAPELQQFLAAASPTGRTVIGGPAAVGEQAADGLAATGRVEGPNRFATAARLARALPRDGNRSDTVLLASGENWPDALAAGTISAAASVPLLLTGRDTLPTETREVLEALSPARVVLVGGPSAVTDQVAEAVAGIAPVQRIAGDTRFATAAAVAELAVEEFGFAATQFNVASGESFADALALAAFAGQTSPRPTPLLLSPAAAAAPATTRFISGHADCGTRRVVIAGGTSAISDAAANDLFNAVGQQPACPDAGDPEITVTMPDGTPVADGAVVAVDDNDGYITLTGTVDHPHVERVTITHLNAADFADNYVGYTANRQVGSLNAARDALLDDNGQWKAPLLMTSPGEYLIAVDVTVIPRAVKRVVFTIDFDADPHDPECNCQYRIDDILVVDNLDGLHMAYGDDGRGTVPTAIRLSYPEAAPGSDRDIVRDALEEVFIQANSETSPDLEHPDRPVLLVTGPDVPDEDAFMVLAEYASDISNIGSPATLEITLRPVTPEEVFAEADFSGDAGTLQPLADPDALEPRGETGCGADVDLAVGRAGVGCAAHLDETVLATLADTDPADPDDDNGDAGERPSRVDLSGTLEGGFDLEFGATIGMDFDLTIRPFSSLRPGLRSGLIERFAATTYGEAYAAAEASIDGTVDGTICPDDEDVAGRTTCGLLGPRAARFGFTIRPHPLLFLRIQVDDIYAQMSASLEGTISAGAEARAGWEFGFECDKGGCRPVNDTGTDLTARATDVAFAGEFDAWIGPRIVISPYGSGVGVWARPEIHFTAEAGTGQDPTVTGGVRANWGLSSGFLDDVIGTDNLEFATVPIWTFSIWPRSSSDFTFVALPNACRAIDLDMAGGQVLIDASADCHGVDPLDLLILDASDGSVTATIPLSREIPSRDARGIWGAAFTNDGNFVVAATEIYLGNGPEYRAFVYDIAADVLIDVTEEFDAKIGSAGDIFIGTWGHEAMADDHTVVFMTEDGTPVFFDVAAREVVSRITLGDTDEWIGESCAISPNGNHLLTEDRIIDMRTGNTTILPTLPGHVAQCAMADDGSVALRVVTRVDFEPVVHIWERDGAPDTTPLPVGEFASELTADGAHIVGCCSDRPGLVDWRSGEVLEARIDGFIFEELWPWDAAGNGGMAYGWSDAASSYGVALLSADAFQPTSND
ncbi:Glycosyl hydrolase, BNR repeat precursor (plasmid) [Euzebya pacifica]|uniref:Glycosyl hydrolase, BNR repeat n=2 Tax=Euzebya pacifica TaxID=1608957 RepID=A0A346Y699_9ACTN|nr:Glycosyl hydrolase, BNR repeat precursor [Euzebya pacifica]